MSVEQLINRNAANWVDRNQGPEPELTRVLEFYVGRDAIISAARLREHVLVIRGMAEADASEVSVAAYLATLEAEIGLADDQHRPRRTTAIALWHIAKCAEVRDRALRLVAHGVRPGAPPAAAT
jgi:hypothetical protein